MTKFLIPTLTLFALLALIMRFLDIEISNNSLAINIFMVGVFILIAIEEKN